MTTTEKFLQVVVDIIADKRSRQQLPLLATFMEIRQALGFDISDIDVAQIAHALEARGQVRIGRCLNDYYVQPTKTEMP